MNTPVLDNFLSMVSASGSEVLFKVTLPSGAEKVLDVNLLWRELKDSLNELEKLAKDKSITARGGLGGQ